jgi:hypothetical protein
MERLGRNVTAVTYAIIEELLNASFSMWPVSYQGKQMISSPQNFLYIHVLTISPNTRMCAVVNGNLSSAKVEAPMKSEAEILLSMPPESRNYYYSALSGTVRAL